MAEAKKASLTVLGGPLTGARCTLPDQGEITIGSAAEATLRVDAPGILPLQARLQVEPGRVSVHALGAGASGLYVNDNPVDPGGTVLRNGDILWLGRPGDDNAVMVQCLLPRRPAAAPVAVTPPSPDATLALPSAPAEAPHAPVGPTPEVQTIALSASPVVAAVAAAPAHDTPPPPAEEPETFVVLPASEVGDEELVFAEQLPVSMPPEPPAEIIEEGFEPEPDAATVPHMMLPDLDRAVFTPAQPAQVAPEPETEFVAADEAVFEETIEESVVGETVIVGPLDETPETVVLAASPVTPAPRPAPRVAPPVVAAPPVASRPSPPPRAAAAPPRAAAPRPAPPAPVPPPAPAPAAEASRAPATPTPPPSASQAARRAARAPQPNHPQASHAQASHPGTPKQAVAPAAPAKAGGGSRVAILAVAGVVVLGILAGLGWAGWHFVLQPRPAGGPSPLPTPVALAVATPVPPPASPEVPAASPTPEATATPAATPSPVATPTPAATPSPKPTPTPKATPTPAAAKPAVAPTAATAPIAAAPTADAARAQQAAQAQGLVEQAQTALTARQYDAAITHADGALRLEPGNAAATSLRADAQRRRDFARRRFVAGQTAVLTQKKSGADLAGFDSGDADVRKAPDFQGRIEFEMSPASGIEGGATWTLRVFVVNDGKKLIRVQGLALSTNTSGGASSSSIPPRTREVAPQQRALVGEAQGTWVEGTTSWASEATITANKGDSLKNTLSWR